MKKNTQVLPDVAGVLCLVLFSGLVFLGGKYMLRCADTLWHIKAGSVMLEQRSLITHDIFSHTAGGKPWIAHEWLSEVIMALCHQVAGLAGVVVFFSLLVACTFWLLLRLAKHYLDDLPALFCVFSALLLAGSHLLARPHLFTWFFGALTLYLLSLRREKLFLLPPITLVWANLHGGFLIGLLVQGIFLGGLLLDNLPRPFSLRQWWVNAGHGKKPALILLLSTLAALATPFGVELFLFPFQVTGEVFINNIGEWTAPNLREMWYFRFYLLIILLLLSLSRERISWTNLLLLLFFVNAAFRHARHVSLAGIFLTPLLIELITPWVEKLWRLLPARKPEAEQLALSPFTGPVITFALAAVLLVTGSVNPPAWQQVSEKIFPLPESFSPAAIHYLTEHPPQGKMFNEYALGGYLIYALNPPQKVFIDGRADMYGEKIFTDYGKIAEVDKEADALLTQYGVDWLIFPWDRPLVRYLSAGGDWSEVYRDSQVAILVRKAPAVRARKGMQTDDKKVAQHLQGMDDGANLGQGAVFPENPHLLDAHSLLSGDIQHLDIKAEAVDPAIWKNLPCRCPMKTLEAALGVADAANGKQPHKFIEDLPHADPVEGLALHDLRGTKGSGTNGKIISILQGGNELAHLPHRRG